MELNFSLNSDELYDTELLARFCDKLVESIGTDIKNGMIPAKFPELEEGLLNAKWINWTEKPDRINIESLIDAICRCIAWRERTFSYQVYIRTDVLMPQTVNTTLEQVARFIDKGNEVTKYSTLLSRVFNNYEKNIEQYWESYKHLGHLLDT